MSKYLQVSVQIPLPSLPDGVKELFPNAPKSVTRQLAKVAISDAEAAAIAGIEAITGADISPDVKFLVIDEPDAVAPAPVETAPATEPAS